MDILVGRDVAADDVVTVQAWLVNDGDRVEAGTDIVEVGTSKATFVVAADRAGYVTHLCREGDRLSAGAALGRIGTNAMERRGFSPCVATATATDAMERRGFSPCAATATATQGLKPLRSIPNEPLRSIDPPVRSRAAQALMDAHGIPPDVFAGLAVVRAADVERLAAEGLNGAPGLPPTREATADRRSPGEGGQPLRGDRRRPGSVVGAQGLQPLRSDSDRDAGAKAPALHRSAPALQAILDILRREMRRDHNRHVPTGTLLNDRWRLARDLGFGDGASVYDECLILGHVVVGAHCWVGPFTILDGSKGTLRIGDHSQIGSGSHLYTHHSIEQCLTGGRAKAVGADTTIGRYCFIGPQSIVAPGTVLGDHSFVAAGSYVEGHFAPFSYLAGTPARRVGRVEIDGDRARLIREEP